MRLSSSPTVVVRGVSKTYFLNQRIRKKLPFVTGKLTPVHALSRINLVASSGEIIGVLGRNGSGKSTLLKLIAGSEKPSSGEIYASTEPALLGVSAALQMDLTGRQNVRLGLLAMGLRRDEVAQKEEAIIEWAELTHAANRPMETYSSGMKAKLKFAISTAIHREILLIDEALSTGDQAFAEKADARMKSVVSNSGTVFLVSHAPSVMQKICTRVVWLHDGIIVADSEPDYAVLSYARWSRLNSEGKTEEAASLFNEVASAYAAPSIIFDSEASKLLEPVPHRAKR